MSTFDDTQISSFPMPSSINGKSVYLQDTAIKDVDFPTPLSETLKEDSEGYLSQEEFASYWSAAAEDFSPENLGICVPLAAEESLRKIWDTPEEDAAWRDLQKEM